MSALVLLAHPAMGESRANAALRDAAEATPGVAVRDLYGLYPDGAIDIAVEQAAAEIADAIVLQHPLYWYSSPPLLKQWIDEVLATGWAYDVFSDAPMALTGTTLASAVTTGAPATEYQPGGWNGRPVREFLLPFEATANFCGMVYAEPFVVHGTFALDDDEIAAAAADYSAWLQGLQG